MQNFIKIWGVIFIIFLGNSNILAQNKSNDIYSTKKSAKIIYRTNKLLVINDSLLYDFDSTTTIPFPHFNIDSLITKSKRITAISSKKRMRALGCDTLYSAIYFIKLENRFMDR